MERADEHDEPAREPDQNGEHGWSDEREKLKDLSRLLGGRETIVPDVNGDPTDDGDDVDVDEEDDSLEDTKVDLVLPELLLDPSSASIAEPGDLISGRFEIVSLSEAPRDRGVQYIACDNAQRGRAVVLELVARGPAARAEDIDERLNELIEKLRTFPDESVYPLREAGRTRDGQLFLVSDLVQGESLRSLRERIGPLRPSHALEIGHQLLTTLAQGHRRNLPHGNVNLDTVILEFRVPWTEENPHSVGVRLIEFGLAGLLDQDRQEPASPRADLRAVGSLLGYLITSLTSDAGLASLSEATAQGMAPATRKLIQRALEKDGPRAFPDADSMLQAIEASPDWRYKQPVKRGIAGWLVAGAALVALTATLVFQPDPDPVLSTAGAVGDRTVQAGQGNGAATVSRRALEESESERARLATVLDDLNVRLGQYERDNANLANTSAALKSERDNLLERIAGMDTERETATDGNAESWSAERADLEARLGTLEADLSAARSAASQGAEREHALLAERDELSERVAALRSSLLEAEAQPETASTWRADSHPSLGAALSSPLVIGADRVRALADDASPADLELALESFRDAALPLLLVEDGMELDRMRLGAIPALGAWGEIARAQGIELELQRLDLARQYYDRSDPLGIPSAADLQLAQGELPLEALPPWRALLTTSLALEEAPGAVTGVLTTRALWMSRTPDGEETHWQFVQATPRSDVPAGKTRAWRIEETYHDTDGRPRSSRVYHLFQRGRRYEEETDAQRASLLIDLADESLSLGRYAPALSRDLDVETIPTRLGVKTARVAAFRDELAGRTALVRRDGQREWWFVPDLGLVRFVDPELIERELVYIERQ